MFTKKELNILYNCVTITLHARVQANEDSWMFEDDVSKKVDPITDELNLLLNRVLDEIKMLDEELHAECLACACL